MVVASLVIHLYTMLVASIKTMGIMCYCLYTIPLCNFGIALTHAICFKNTLVSNYQKLFGSLNPPRFSIDGNYPGISHNFKLPSDSLNNRWKWINQSINQINNAMISSSISVIFSKFHKSVLETIKILQGILTILDKWQLSQAWAWYLSWKVLRAHNWKKKLKK